MAPVASAPGKEGLGCDFQDLPVSLDFKKIINWCYLWVIRVFFFSFLLFPSHRLGIIFSIIYGTGEDEKGPQFTWLVNRGSRMSVKRLAISILLKMNYFAA